MVLLLRLQRCISNYQQIVSRTFVTTPLKQSFISIQNLKIAKPTLIYQGNEKSRYYKYMGYCTISMGLFCICLTGTAIDTVFNNSSINDDVEIHSSWLDYVKYFLPAAFGLAYNAVRSRLPLFGFGSMNGMKKLVQTVNKLPTVRFAVRVKEKLFSKYLLQTNVVISSLGSAFSDIACQHLEIVTKAKAFTDDGILKKSGVDWRRVTRFGMCGLVLGPFCHYWYLGLDSVFVGTTLKPMMWKVATDTMIFSPAFIVAFFWVQGKISFCPPGAWNKELKERGPQIWLAEATIWAPVQYINFRFLPTRYRIAYDSSVSFLFDMYYSFVYNKKHPS